MERRTLLDRPRGRSRFGSHSRGGVLNVPANGCTRVPAIGVASRISTSSGVSGSVSVTPSRALRCARGTPQRRDPVLGADVGRHDQFFERPRLDMVPSEDPV